MPPSARADRYIPDTQNTRALLRSLEELRDSLSQRVDQLSQAVERLRSQAGELQRSLAAEDDLGLGRLSISDNEASNIVPASRRHHTRGSNDTNRRDNSRTIPNESPAHRDPSSILNDVANLSRPISIDEISALLDRASQPLPPPQPTSTAGSTGPLSWPTRRHERLSEAEARVEASIADLRNRARELRRMAVQPLGSHTGEERQPRSGNATPHRRLQHDRDRVTPRTHVRHDPIPDGGLPRRRGLAPTNLNTRSRSPTVIRSMPASPTSTITPDALLSTAFPGTETDLISPLDTSLDNLAGSESPPARAPIPLPDTESTRGSARSSPVAGGRHRTPPAILIETTPAGDEGHQPGYATYVPVSTPQPEEVVLDMPYSWEENRWIDLSPSASTAPRPRPRPRPRPNAESSLTSRGMRVEARIGDDATSSSRLNADSDRVSFIAAFPTLRDLFDDEQRYSAMTSGLDITNVQAYNDLSASGDTPGRRRDARGFSHNPTIERLRNPRNTSTPQMEQIRAIQAEQGDQLRSIAQDIVRSRPNPTITRAGPTPAGDSSATRERDQMREERQRIMRDRVRQERIWQERSHIDRDPDARPSDSNDDFARVRRGVPRPSPTVAATVATSDRTDSSASTSTFASTSGAQRPNLSPQSDGTTQTNVDSPLPLSRYLEADRTAARESIERARVRMRELADLRRDIAEIQQVPTRGNADAGVIDLVQVLNTTNESPRTSSTRAEESAVVFEGSGERRETRRTSSRDGHNAEDDEETDPNGPRGSVGTMAQLKEGDLDAHLWVQPPGPMRGREPGQRRYISMLNL